MCYCGDKLSYEEHCEKYIKGEKIAETPLELMKSRYSAFATNNYKYIYDTYHNETRDFTLEELKNQDGSNWMGLEIVDFDNEKGIVTFIAKYKSGNEIFLHKERSKFLMVDGKWYYHSTLPFPKVEKVKPNEPCPCGSGKKYKKCCGK